MSTTAVLVWVRPRMLRSSVSEFAEVPVVDSGDSCQVVAGFSDVNVGGGAGAVVCGFRGIVTAVEGPRKVPGVGAALPDV